MRHHKREIALILSAMRHFADELRSAGFAAPRRGLGAVIFPSPVLAEEGL